MHAHSELAACQTELTRIRASHQQELHGKDALISQLRAALSAQEAARAGAEEQKRLAHQETSCCRV